MASRAVIPLMKNCKCRGKRVLVRVEFNVPVVGGKIRDAFRIKRCKETIDYLCAKGAVVILMTHLERSDGKKQFSLGLISKQIEKILGRKVRFIGNKPERALSDARMGETYLLENVRFNKGEKKNDPKFARYLASFGDLYVNEAFGVAHRPHASIIGIPKYLPSYAGLLFAREVEVLRETLKPKHPFLLIVGGIKFQTRFKLLKNFLPKADTIFLGGVLANTFMKARGYNVGKSIVDESAIPVIKRVFLKKSKILLPQDVVVAPGKRLRDSDDVAAREIIYDAGEKTILQLGDIIKRSKLVVWNGPFGFIEGGYDAGTKRLIELLSGAGARVVIGGGDTVSVITAMKMEKKFYHVSTGGGAMLSFLSDGTLVGLEALMKSRRLK